MRETVKWKQTSGQDPNYYIMKSVGFILFNKKWCKGNKQGSNINRFIFLEKLERFFRRN